MKKLCRHHQSMNGKQNYADEIHEAVCTWCEMKSSRGARSTDCGSHRVLGHADLMSRFPRSIAGCLHDAVGGGMAVPKRSQPSRVLYARSDVAHTVRELSWC